MKILGENYHVRADVRVIRLSGHADANELMSFCDHFDRDKMKHIFLDWIGNNQGNSECFRTSGRGGTAFQGMCTIHYCENLRRMSI